MEKKGRYVREGRRRSWKQIWDRKTFYTSRESLKYNSQENNGRDSTGSIVNEADDELVV